MKRSLSSTLSLGSSLSGSDRPAKRAAAKSAETSIKSFLKEEELPSSSSSSAAGASSSGASQSTVVITSAYRLNPGLYIGPPPTRSSDGVLRFESGYEAFEPNMSPDEVLRAGSFGGGYFRDIYSSVTRTHYKDAWKEFPSAWFDGLNIQKKIARPVYDAASNKFGVKCGQDLNAWESSGWITQWDPYGWFAWYCRFYLGRRCPDDARQILRWVGVAGAKGRWKSNLAAKVLSAKTSYDDPTVSPVVRQTLQHWAYTLSEADYKAQSKRIAKGSGVSFISAPQLASAAAAAVEERKDDKKLKHKAKKGGGGKTE